MHVSVWMSDVHDKVFGIRFIRFRVQQEMYYWS